MGYKKSDRCIQKAFDDEPIFVLMARDPMAYPTVMFWIALSKDHHDGAKIEEATKHAQEMFRTYPEFKLRAEEAYDKHLHSSGHDFSYPIQESPQQIDKMTVIGGLMEELQNLKHEHHKLQEAYNLEVKSNENLRKEHDYEAKRASQLAKNNLKLENLNAQQANKLLEFYKIANMDTDKFSTSYKG